MRIIDAVHGKLQFEQTISSDQFALARALPGFGKLFIRDYPRRSRTGTKHRPRPVAAREVIEKTPTEYLEGLRRLTGHELA